MKKLTLYSLMFISFFLASCQENAAAKNKAQIITDKTGNTIHWKLRLNEIDEAIITEDVKKSDKLLQALMHEYESQLIKDSNTETEDKIFQMAERLNTIAIQKGNYDIAELYGMSLLGYKEKRFGTVSDEYVLGLGNLSAIYYLKGDVDQSIKLTQSALDICETKRFEFYQTCERLLRNQSKKYLSIGNFSQAEIYAMKRYQLVKNVKGETHSEIIPTMNILAEVYTNQKRIQEAHDLYKRGVGIAEKEYGFDHVATKLMKKNLSEFESQYKLK